MSPPDFRALCAELVDELDYQTSNHEVDELITRARAALAEPEGKWPTDEELIEPIMWMIDELVYDKGEIAEILRELIARWGHLATHPAPEPIPVSERLPGEKDCNAEGSCWLLHVDKLGLFEWHFLNRYPSLDSYSYYGYTHWLPAHAIPLPLAGEVEE